MFNLLFRAIFLIISVFILIKTCFYGSFEINTQKNKSGGIAIIVFAIISIVLANVVLFIE